MNEHLNADQLTDYLHGALAPEDDASAHAHLAACAACAAAYEADARLTEALRENARGTEREFPEGVRATIRSLAAAAGRRPSLWERLRAWLRPAVLVPIAAAAAVALFVVPRFTQPHASPRIQAAYYLEDHADLNGTMPFDDETTAVPASLTTQDDQSGQSSSAAVPAVVTADDAP